METVLEHMPPKRAFDLVLTSRQVHAAEAIEVGLLSRVVPNSQLETAWNALKRTFVHATRAIGQQEISSVDHEGCQMRLEVP
jgi:enoyl-CoA hydratase/carnithine racemase